MGGEYPATPGGAGEPCQLPRHFWERLKEEQEEQPRKEKHKQEPQEIRKEKPRITTTKADHIRGDHSGNNCCNSQRKAPQRSSAEEAAQPLEPGAPLHQTVQPKSSSEEAAAQSGFPGAAPLRLRPQTQQEPQELKKEKHKQEPQELRKE